MFKLLLSPVMVHKFARAHLIGCEIGVRVISYAALWQAAHVTWHRAYFVVSVTTEYGWIADDGGDVTDGCVR
jgi:hypothetical protein